MFTKNPNSSANGTSNHKFNNKSDSLFGSVTVCRAMIIVAFSACFLSGVAASYISYLIFIGITLLFFQILNECTPFQHFSLMHPKSRGTFFINTLEHQPLFQ